MFDQDSIFVGLGVILVGAIGLFVGIVAITGAFVVAEWLFGLT